MRKLKILTSYSQDRSVKIADLFKTRFRFGKVKQNEIKKKLRNLIVLTILVTSITLLGGPVLLLVAAFILNLAGVL